MKRWFVVALTAALLTAGVVAAVAVAGGGDGPTGLVDRGVRALTGAAGDDASPGGGQGAWRYCGEDAFRAGPALDALEDPEARAEAEALRERHRAEMREWWESHGDDPQARDAKDALGALRERQREELEALCDKYGVEVPEGTRLGDGGRARGMFGDGDGEGCGHGYGLSGGAGAGSGAGL